MNKMAGKETKKKSETNCSDKEQEKKSEKGLGKVKLEMPRELREKIKAEKNPDAVVADALKEYYTGRNESAVQKEIDNNIIEIQRRHISDLKEQLETSNKNYEELMKTYQAYMLQIQPLVESAKLQEASAGADKLPAGTQTETKAEEIKKGTAEPEGKTKKWYEFWK